MIMLYDCSSVFTVTIILFNVKEHSPKLGHEAYCVIGFARAKSITCKWYLAIPVVGLLVLMCSSMGRLVNPVQWPGGFISDICVTV